MNLGIIKKHCCARKTALIMNAGKRQLICDSWDEEREAPVEYMKGGDGMKKIL